MPSTEPRVWKASRMLEICLPFQCDTMQHCSGTADDGRSVCVYTKDPSICLFVIGDYCICFLTVLSHCLGQSDLKHFFHPSDFLSEKPELKITRGNEATTLNIINLIFIPSSPCRLCRAKFWGL